MPTITETASNLPTLLKQYEEWCQTTGMVRYLAESRRDGWAHPWEAPFVKAATNLEFKQIKKLETQFGPLPQSYVDVLLSIGSCGFRSESSGLLRILSSDDVLALYDNIQGQMNFSDGLREEILEEDGIDFHKLIPVMAGSGTDGLWGLLDLSSPTGQVFYWDNDQAGYLEDVFQDLASFVAYLLQQATSDTPPRLT